MVRDAYYEGSPSEDHFGYGGTVFESVIKHRRSSHTVLELGGATHTRHYSGIPALDLAGLPLEPQQMRSDRRTQVHARVRHPLAFGFADHLAEVLLHLDYIYRHNTSNDPYYDYSAQSFSTGLEIRL